MFRFGQEMCTLRGVITTGADPLVWAISTLNVWFGFVCWIHIEVQRMDLAGDVEKIATKRLMVFGRDNGRQETERWASVVVGSLSTLEVAEFRHRWHRYDPDSGETVRDND